MEKLWKALDLPAEAPAASVVGKPPAAAAGDAPKLIVTHDGRFHADDVLACVLLRFLPTYANSVIVRTRKADIIEKADVVVDVGGVYDVTTRRFDHHQRGFDQGFHKEKSDVTKMSSAGMVWKWRGRDLCLQFLEKTPSANDVKVAEHMWISIYKSLIESIDAIDNGVNIGPGNTPPAYLVRSDLSSRVARLNLDWTDTRWDDVAEAEFVEAMKLAREEFLWHVYVYAHVALPARTIVREGFAKRFATHSSGRVLELSGGGCPWETHLFEVEVEEGLDAATEGLLFVIHPGNGDWRVRAVRSDAASFGNRMSLLEAARGLRDGAFGALGLPDVNFVHQAGFLAGVKNREAAISLIEKTFEDEAAKAKAKAQAAKPREGAAGTESAAETVESLSPADAGKSAAKSGNPTLAPG